MSAAPQVRGIVPYVFCLDAGAVADWCVEVLGFVERDRWTREDGSIGNVELVVGDSEVWLDGGVDWQERLEGLAWWTGFWVDDVDAMYDYVRTRLSDVAPPVDREFGIRMLTVSDPEGHQWGFMPRNDAAPPGDG